MSNQTSYELVAILDLKATQRLHKTANSSPSLWEGWRSRASYYRLRTKYLEGLRENKS